MKIHRWSPWLRRHHTWAPFTLFVLDFIAWQLPWVSILGVTLWHASYGSGRLSERHH